jgi:ribosomal-protein-alanine N-acetyltransferase
MSPESNTVHDFFVSQPRIETERLLLRPLETSDAESIYTYAKKPEVTKYVIFETHTSIDDSYGFLREVAKWREEASNAVWGITLRDGGKLLGTIGLHRYEADHKSVEVGYAIDVPYWNNGYTTEALAALIKTAFTATDLNRIHAHHYSPNTSSGRVMEKAGMRYEGHARERIFVKGEFRDIEIYAILRSDLGLPKI